MNQKGVKYRRCAHILLYFIMTFALLLTGCQSSATSGAQNLQDADASGLRIVTVSLSEGVSGSTYSAALSAEGGAPAYSWSLTFGSLPQGLALDNGSGVISGTPAVSGSFSFTVQVTDASSGTDSENFTLIISTSDDEDADDDTPSAADCGCEPLDTVVGSVIQVSSVSQLESAVSTVNSAGGNRTILVADGTYVLNNILYITADNVVIRSASGDRSKVLLLGKGMSGNVGHIFLVAGSDVTIADMTLGEVFYHAIQVQGEQGANNLLVHNTRIFNTHEQMIKGSFSTSTNQGSDHGTVRCSLLEYTENFGPQYYIGGIDVHRGANWHVHNNTFRNIRSPENGNIAEHAIHFWSSSSNPLIEKNVIINCDRGIGLGLGSSPCTGGIIRNNTVYADVNGLNSDVGIALESASNVHVYHNTIFFDHSYTNAIEYRFAAATGNMIINNLSNKAITSRNSGSATVRSNVTSAAASWFTDRTAGNLHLASSVASVTGMGETLASVTEDMDCEARPGSAPDIGADQR